MAQQTVVPAQPSARRWQSRVRDVWHRPHFRPTWTRAALAAVLLLSLAVQGYRLTSIGWGNLYYAAAVRSMLDNPSAFFYASFDALGFVTVDKPPAGLWVQALFARVLGVHGLVLLLPQLLAVVGSVALLYYLVQRTCGAAAGLLAALTLALTPISVVAGRGNNLDSLLVLVVLVAAWTALLAVEHGQLRWLLACAALVGLGFNIKMLQAFLVAPAFTLLYLAAAPAGVLKRLEHLLQAGAVLAAVSLSWALVVEAVPAEQRPYIGSSQENSAIELALGYNGLQRLRGADRTRPGGPPDRPGAGAFPPGAAGPGPNAGRVPAGPEPAGGPPPNGPGPAAGQPPGPGNAPPGGPLPPGPGEAENGAPGILRLFNRQLGSQIGWLVPLSCLAAVLVWSRRPRPRQDRRQQAALLWGGWLLTGAAFFSVAGFFHTYYLTMLGPPVAALTGMAAAELWRRFRVGGWQATLAPLALLGTAAVQAFILWHTPEWRGRLLPVVLGGSVALAAVLVASLRVSRVRMYLHPAAAGGLATVILLVSPAVWVWGTVSQTANASLPRAIAPGAARPGAFGPPPTQNVRTVAAPALVAYLERNQGSAPYLAATGNAQLASPLIITTGKPVMALGGFSGSDPILTVGALKARVAAGEVRYVLVGGLGQPALIEWIVTACTFIPPPVWLGEASAGSPAPPSGGVQRPFTMTPPLYDCGTPRG